MFILHAELQCTLIYFHYYSKIKLHFFYLILSFKFNIIKPNTISSFNFKIFKAKSDFLLIICIFVLNTVQRH